MILRPLDWAIIALHFAVSLPNFGVAMIAVVPAAQEAVA